MSPSGGHAAQPPGLGSRGKGTWLLLSKSCASYISHLRLVAAHPDLARSMHSIPLGTFKTEWDLRQAPIRPDARSAPFH